MPVNDGRRARILHRFGAISADPALTLGDALCATSVDVLEVAGAGITLHGRTSGSYTLAASNPVMADLQDLERLLGEGPCIDAYQLGRPAAAPDLREPAAPRWPAFRSEALRTEARAAFGYPLQVGTTRLGALNLYATTPGPLSAEQQLDAVTLADLATHSVLAALGDERIGPSRELEDLGDDQMAVHQATGMISVQASLPIIDALARLRARAYAEGRPIGALAADVVARRIRFEA